MVKCHICKNEIVQGKGITLATAEGKLFHFCSRKCRIAFKLGRSKKLGWIRKKKK